MGDASRCLLTLSACWINLIVSHQDTVFAKRITFHESHHFNQILGIKWQTRRTNDRSWLPVNHQYKPQILEAPWHRSGKEAPPRLWAWITEVKMTKYNDLGNDTLNIHAVYWRQCYVCFLPHPIAGWAAYLISASTPSFISLNMAFE